MTKKEETKKPGNAPIFRDRQGPVSVSVFLNKAKDGKEFPSAIIRRSYKQGDKYVDSNSYGLRHLKDLAEIVAETQRWMKKHYPGAE